MELDSLYYSSTATSLPARHFPAFAAAGRVGAGFRVEGRNSNAAYNRHLVGLKPRTAPAAVVTTAQGSSTTTSSSSTTTSGSSIITHTLSPERVNAAAQAGLAQAAALSGRVTLKSGSWDHVLCTSSSSSSHSPAAGTKPGSAWSTLPEGPGPAASSAGCAGSLPTTYCRSQALQHSLWLHDGTDFTRGHMQQVLNRRPSSAPAAGRNPHLHFTATSTAAGLSRAGGGSSSRLTSRLMQPRQQHWRAKQSRPVSGVASAELQALLGRCTAAIRHRSSNGHSQIPEQISRTQQEEQQPTETSWLSQSHPVEGAKYMNRSAGLHSSRVSVDKSQPSFGGYGCMPNELHSLQSSGLCRGSCISCTNHCCGCSEDPCGASSCVWCLGAGEADVGAVYVRSSARNPAIKPQATATARQVDTELQHELQPHASLSAAVAAECAGARAAAAAAAAARSAPAPAWWEGDVLLAQRVKQLMQPSQREASGCTTVSSSATLRVYDALLAADANRVAQLQGAGQLGGDMLRPLQLSEQLHDAWVAELRGRSAAQRLRQVLAEAACCSAVGGH